MEDRQTKLAVRCCCQPQKVLGYLPVPSLTLRYVTLLVPIPNTAYYETATLEIAPIIIGDHQELAIKSEDRPVEFWRTIAGFEEA